MVLIVVSHPINSQHHKADSIGQKPRPKLPQFMSQAEPGHSRYDWDLDIEHHQGHRDSKDAIGQGFNSGLAESSTRTRVAHDETPYRVCRSGSVPFSDWIVLTGVALGVCRWPGLITVRHQAKLLFSGGPPWQSLRRPSRATLGASSAAR